MKYAPIACLLLALVFAPGGYGDHDTNPVPIYVTIVMHSEQTARYDLNPVLFETSRTNLFRFASLLSQRGVAFNFQSDWTFLTAVTNYDRLGRVETGGTNIVAWMERDLGFAIDPHNHINQSIYNYADVAALITRCGATPTPVAGGFIASPAASNELRVLAGTITGAVYTTSTWEAGTLWGGASFGHVNETSLWFSGVYAPADATNWWRHREGALPMVGGYGGRTVTWTNLDQLIALRDAGQLCTGTLYTCNLMVNMSELSPAFILTFDARLQTYTNHPALHWATISEITNSWATTYARRPSYLPWRRSGDLDTDGLPDGWEVTNFCGICASDGNGDTDGDAWTDAEEYVTDTAPDDAASYWSNDWNLEDATFPTLGIPDSSAACRYVVERATNLDQNAWTPVTAPTPGHGGLLTLTVTNTHDTAYYRTAVTRP